MRPVLHHKYLQPPFLHSMFSRLVLRMHVYDVYMPFFIHLNFSLFSFADIKRQISISPKSVRVELGGRAELICSVNATPVAKIAWYKNGIPLVPNPPVVITVEDKVLIAHVTMQVSQFT